MAKDDLKIIAEHIADIRHDDEHTALALALREIEELRKLHADNAKEIASLKSWKNSCTIWAAWWAGICAAVMTLATLIRTYWSDISTWFRMHP